MTVWHPAWGELRARLVIERRRRLAWRELEVRLVTERRLERAPVAAVLDGNVGSWSIGIACARPIFKPRKVL